MGDQSMNERVDTPSKPDRVLGDEWENWTGDLDESKIFNETAKLFTIYASISVLIILGLLVIILYMIEPRLYLFHPILVHTARVITILLVSVSVIWAILIFTCVFTGKKLIRNSRFGQLAASKILPLAIIIARRLGISRDRLGNSFVSFSNAIVKASHKPDGGKTIILLPRCLNSDMKKMVRDMGKAFLIFPMVQPL